MKHRNGMMNTVYYSRGKEKAQHYEGLGYREAYRHSCREFKRYGTSWLLIRKAAKACLRSLKNNGINATMRKIDNASGFGGYEVLYNHGVHNFLV